MAIRFSLQTFMVMTFLVALLLGVGVAIYSAYEQRHKNELLFWEIDAVCLQLKQKFRGLDLSYVYRGMGFSSSGNQEMDWRLEHHGKNLCWMNFELKKDSGEQIIEVRGEYGKDDQAFITAVQQTLQVKGWKIMWNVRAREAFPVESTTP